MGSGSRLHVQGRGVDCSARSHAVRCDSHVLAWDDVGDLLAVIATRLLHLPLFRYVDDYFAADR